MEQKNKGRARVKIAVFFVLAVHGIGLMALLMQGCGQSKESAPPMEITDSNPPPAFVESAPPPVTTSTPPVVATAPTVSEPPAPPPPVAPPGATEYAIVKGDYLEKIAKNFHVSVKALLEANPGIEPTKLQIGQKIHIPASVTSAAPAPAGVAPAETTSAGGGQIYTVKSGDNLTKIATKFGTTIKALRAANDLKTDSIKVGQKLTVPVAGSAPATAPVAPIEAPPPPAAPPPGR